MNENTEQSARLDKVKECLIPVGVIPRCIDDRASIVFPEGSLPEYVVKPEEANGPQFLGGSVGIFALVVEHFAVNEKEFDFNTIFNITSAIHEEQGWQLGVHMDNHHGEWDGQELTVKLEAIQTGKLGNGSIIPGCGFAGLLSHKDNPLGLSEKAHAFFVANPNIVDEFVRRGAKLSILTGDHAPKPNAFAVENMDSGNTLDTAKAIKEGAQSYSHDTGSLQNAMGYFEEKVVVEILGTNNKWLAATTNILAGMDPKTLPTAA